MTVIKDIKPNNVLSLVVIINRVIQGVASNNTNYLNLQLQDKTGTISARIWDVSKETIDQLTIGQVIKIEANSINYNNEIQLKINNWTIITNPSEYYDLLLTKAPINIIEVWTEISQTIKEFKNPILKKVLIQCFNKKNVDDYKKWPAAVKMHHAVQGGLLWHSVTMLRMAKQVVALYNDRNIDIELLYAGIIMHDYGKMVELNNNPISSYTLSGKMIGHISLGAMQVTLACKELNINLEEEIVVLLQHLILASHGKYEYGSPVLPKTIEAEILHHLDNLDAKIYAIDEALVNINVGESTARIASIENRMFYKHQNLKEKNKKV